MPLLSLQAAGVALLSEGLSFMPQSEGAMPHYTFLPSSFSEALKNPGRFCFGCPNKPCGLGGIFQAKSSFPWPDAQSPPRMQQALSPLTHYQSMQGCGWEGACSPLRWRSHLVGSSPATIARVLSFPKPRQ